MGSRGPGAKGVSALTERLGLSLLVGLVFEGKALGLSALLACDHDNQLFLGLRR